MTDKMTNQEAIEKLEAFAPMVVDDTREALDMAIEALQTEVIQGVGRYENAMQKLREMPRYLRGIKEKQIKKNTAPIVRCTDCDDYVEFAYWFDDEGKKRDCHYCTFHSMEVHGDDFCSWAKRKEQTNDKTD